MEIKQKFNIIVDALMLITGLITFVTSIALYFGIYFGFARRDFVILHNPIGLIFAILFLVHIILHFNWFKNLPKMILPSNKNQLP